MSVDLAPSGKLSAKRARSGGDRDSHTEEGGDGERSEKRTKREDSPVSVANCAFE